MQPEHDTRRVSGPPDLEGRFPSLPIRDNLARRQRDSGVLPGSESARIIGAALSCLTSAELSGFEPEASGQPAHPGRRLLISDRIDRQSRRLGARACQSCLYSECSSNQEHQHAVAHVTDRALPVSERRSLLRRLRCRRRATPQVLDRLATCLAPQEPPRVRLTGVMVLSVLGQTATALVPRLLEMLNVEAAPDPAELDSWDWRRELEHALVQCLTEGQDEAWSYLGARLNPQTAGMETTRRLIHELATCRAYESQVVDRLGALVLKAETPLELRLAAAHSLAPFPDLLGPHVPGLCELYGAAATPLELRDELLRVLRLAAAPDNAAAEAIAGVALEETAPRSLRLKSLWSFRRMAPEVRHHARQPAQSHLSSLQPAPVADIAFLLTASTFWHAGPVLVPADEDTCLRSLILAASQARLVAPEPGPADPLIPPRFLQLAVGTEWLNRALGQILRKRGRAFIGESRADLLQSLYFYLAELLAENELPLPTTPAVTREFHRRVLDRVDSRARHRFLRDHAVPDCEQHGPVSVTRLDRLDGLVSAAPSPEEVVTARELSQLLHAVLETDLSALEQKLVWAFHVDGQTLDALAAELGRGRDQIWRAIHKAQQRLRTTLSRVIA